MKARRPAVALFLALGLGLALFPAATELKLQSSAWLALNDDTPSTPRVGLRFQPLLSLSLPLGGPWQIDSEISLAVSASGSAPAWHDPGVEGDLQPYRLWLRLSTSRFEARLGLQKINFGSATVFRPLMWFDRVDPRDPLQLTDGVYGLLLRCYFKSNANAWLWGLYGNVDAKGWETRITAKRTPEFGGRFQAPLLAGEAGITFHCRRLDPGTATVRPTESRLALDGKWDVGVGLWVETSFVHQDDPAAALAWQRALAAGVDYTFALGNGLYLLAEQYFAQVAATALGRPDGGTTLSALLARYPLSLLDSLNAFIYYDWRNRQAYSFASWQRTYDRWQFHLMAFWNPRQARIAGAPSAGSLFSGRGFQVQAVWSI
jgi:hypothetical protein